MCSRACPLTSLACVHSGVSEQLRVVSLNRLSVGCVTTPRRVEGTDWVTEATMRVTSALSTKNGALDGSTLPFQVKLGWGCAALILVLIKVISINL